MADKIPNVAEMEMGEYIEARIAQLTDTAKQILLFDDPANEAQLRHMFSVEYIRNRHAMLEQNCLQLLRRYLAAMQALENSVGKDRARELFVHALETIPTDMREIPQL